MHKMDGVWTSVNMSSNCNHILVNMSGTKACAYISQRAFTSLLSFSLSQPSGVIISMSFKTVADLESGCTSYST
jgi:hypothetical protein